MPESLPRQSRSEAYSRVRGYLARARAVRWASGGEMPDVWPNGVPYIDEDARKKNLSDPAALRDLICHLWIHSGYSEQGQVRKMTTEQKELYADVIDSMSRGEVPVLYDRWWQR